VENHPPGSVKKALDDHRFRADLQPQIDGQAIPALTLYNGFSLMIRFALTVFPW
jgi:hypothetical protein